MAIFSKKNLVEPKIIKTHTVLLVDDEPANLSVMQTLLEQSCHVLTAENGEQAMEVLRNHGDKELSMIMSDQRMPGMTGAQLLEQTLASHPDTLRLIVSGYSDLGAVLEAINKAKIYHFITKPFDSTDFLLTVKQALNVYDFKKEIKTKMSALNSQLSSCRLKRKETEQQLEQALSKLAELGY